MRNWTNEGWTNLYDGRPVETDEETISLETKIAVLKAAITQRIDNSSYYVIYDVRKEEYFFSTTDVVKRHGSFEIIGRLAEFI